MKDALFLKLTPLAKAKPLSVDKVALLILKCYWAGMNETNTDGQVPFGMPTRHSRCMETGRFMCSDAPNPRDKSTWTDFDMHWTPGFTSRPPSVRDAWGWASNIYRGLGAWTRQLGGLPEGQLKVHLGAIDGPDIFTGLLKYQLTSRPSTDLGGNFTAGNTFNVTNPVGTS